MTIQTTTMLPAPQEPSDSPAVDSLRDQALELGVIAVRRHAEALPAGDETDSAYQDLVLHSINLYLAFGLVSALTALNRSDPALAAEVAARVLTTQQDDPDMIKEWLRHQVKTYGLPDPMQEHG